MTYASVTLLFFSVIMMVMTRLSIASNLTELLKGEDATVSQTRLADAVPLIVYSGIATLVVLALLEWAVAVTLSRRRIWPRLFLIPVAVVHLFIVLLVGALIPVGSWQGVLLVAALLVSGLLALVAAVRSFAPSVNAWLRARHDEENAAQAAG